MYIFIAAVVDPGLVKRDIFMIVFQNSKLFNH